MPIHPADGDPSGKTTTYRFLCTNAKQDRQHEDGADDPPAFHGTIIRQMKVKLDN